MSNSSIWPIVRTQPGATSQGQSRHESNGHEGYSKAPGLELHHQSFFGWACFTPLQRCYQSILVPQPTGQAPSYALGIKLHHHHHHLVLAARIFLTLSRHSSLSFIALGRSSGQQPVSSHSCWMYVRAGRPAFARPCVGIHKSTSLMSSSLLLQQCPACLVRLTWIDFVIGGRWPYSWCLVGCCCQDLFRIARSILV